MIDDPKDAHSLIVNGVGLINSFGSEGEQLGGRIPTSKLFYHCFTGYPLVITYKQGVLHYTGGELPRSTQEL